MVALGAAACSGAPADSAPGSAAGPPPSAVAGTVPTAIPAAGVQLDQTDPQGKVIGVEAYLYPASPVSGELTRDQAVRAAQGSAPTATAPITAAVLARVTLPLTVPPAGAAPRAGEVLRRPAWVVAWERLSTDPADTFQTVEIIDARTGQALGGFEIK